MLFVLRKVIFWSSFIPRCNIVPRWTTGSPCGFCCSVLSRGLGIPPTIGVVIFWNTSLVSQRISNLEPVPTATCFAHEHDATMLVNESVWHFSAARSKHLFGVYNNKVTNKCRMIRNLHSYKFRTKSVTTMFLQCIWKVLSTSYR